MSMVNWDTVPTVEAYPGITRQQRSGAQTTVTRYTYQPASVFPVHDHPEEQITIVHSGRIRFTVGGDVVEMGAGDVAVIPGGVPHGAIVLSDVAVVSDNYLPVGQRAPLRVLEDATTE